MQSAPLNRNGRFLLSSLACCLGAALLGSTNDRNVAVVSRPSHATFVAYPAHPILGVTAAASICSHFRLNPMCRPLPANPALAPNSHIWSVAEFQQIQNGPLQYLTITTALKPFSDPLDDSEPLDEFNPGDPYFTQKILCDQWPTGPKECALTAMNHKVIAVPVKMEPEGAPDHHYSFDDYSRNGEQDFWLAPMPNPHTGELHVGGAGFCSWGTDGTGCSGSTATNIATGLGRLDPTLIKDAERDKVHGHLPYAIATSALCADENWVFVYPATQSDGSNTDTTPKCQAFLKPGMRPPEGTRWFLALHDADINSKPYAEWVKVVLRTIDEDHMGALITDTGWSGGSGMSPMFGRGEWSFAAYEMGIDPTKGDYELPFNVTGLDFEKNARFCASGTC